MTRLSGPELAALKTVALADGQTDPLPEILADVIHEVRGYVSACGRNTLAEGATIPEKLKGAALAMIRYRLVTRLPAKSLMNDDRRKENSDALHLMRDVAGCKFAVDEPTTPAATQPAVLPSPTVSVRAARRATHGHQDGL